MLILSGSAAKDLEPLMYRNVSSAENSPRPNHQTRERLELIHTYIHIPVCACWHTHTWLQQKLVPDQATKQGSVCNTYIIYLFTGDEDDCKFIVPQDSSYFTRRSSPTNKMFFGSVKYISIYWQFGQLKVYDHYLHSPHGSSKMVFYCLYIHLSCNKLLNLSLINI